MTQKTFPSNAEYNVLTAVREGMPVFDMENRKIGKVKYVQFGDAHGEAPFHKPTEFYNLPSEVQVRMLRDGFVQIDTGFFSADRFAQPDQIAELNDERLRLNVTSDELFSA